MSTTQEPDFAGIANTAAEERFLQPDIRPTGGRVDAIQWIEGYASCMEAKLRSDWETIAVLKRVRHERGCGVTTGHWENIPGGLRMWKELPCSCGLDEHLSTLEAQFQ